MFVLFQSHIKYISLLFILSPHYSPTILKGIYTLFSKTTKYVTPFCFLIVQTPSESLQNHRPTRLCDPQPYLNEYQRGIE